MAKNSRKLGAVQDAPQSTIGPEAVNTPSGTPETQGEPLASVPTGTTAPAPTPKAAAPVVAPEWIGLAAAFGHNHHVPRALLLAVAYLETGFGKTAAERCNVFNIVPLGTEGKGKSGLAWYHSYPECFERFCLILTRREGFPRDFADLDYPYHFAAAWEKDEAYGDKLKLIIKQMEELK